MVLKYHVSSKCLSNLSCHVHLTVSIFLQSSLQVSIFCKGNKVSKYQFVCLFYKLECHLHILERESLQLVFKTLKTQNVLASQEENQSHLLAKLYYSPPLQLLAQGTLDLSTRTRLSTSMTFQFLFAGFTLSHPTLYPTHHISYPLYIKPT